VGWIGVDLDGTLAEYDGWQGSDTIGAPVPAMVDRVKGWLVEGREVRIVTARAFPPTVATLTARRVVEDWSLEHIGQALPVTCMKDFGMVELWDDRAVTVEANTGRALAPSKVELLDEASRALDTVAEDC
jgi:hypothetical protein